MITAHSKKFFVPRKLPKSFLFLLGLGILCCASFGFADDLQSNGPATLNAGDQLLISIPGADPPEQTYTIANDGNVDLGIHGKVMLAGLSIRAAGKAVRSHMTKYLNSTKGIVVLLKESGQTVLVTGCVTQPGLVTVESTGDIWRAIYLAGGLAPCADLTNIVIATNGSESRYDLRAHLTRESKDPLPLITAGDTIFVSAQSGMSPALDTSAVFLGSNAVKTKVFVIGAVANPGIFERTDVLNALTAVSLAGGPSAGADLSHTIILTKDKSTTINLQKILKGETKQGTSLLPKPGESGVIIYLPTMAENIDNRIGEYINVIGPFVRSGRIPVSGPITLVDAIGLVGGPTENARIRRIRVIEEGPGYTLVNRYNMKKYYEDGGFVGRVMIRPGSTLIVGKSHFPTVANVLRIVGNVAMISSAVVMWITFANGVSTNAY